MEKPQPIKKYLILLSLLAKSCLGSFNDGPVVTTSIGKILGSTMESANGSEFLAFRGVPYAKPPINDLRFQDPVEPEPWRGTLDCTREGPKCIQFKIHASRIEGDEDCLYLNIYTHNVEASVSKRPVMVWIHGGAFFTGSGNGENDMYGPELLMDRDIVLVTINYRLGPLGFLSTEDSVAPGNYGLLDQEMALRWVKNNIGDFGGDAESITIFGFSAGGASVEFHVLSQRSQGFFHRAIAQSGNALCDWAVSDTVKHFTEMLALQLNCPVSSSRSMLDCLREKDAEEIVNFRGRIETYGYFPIAFGPRVDKEREDPFLREHPRDLLRSGNFNHVPFMTGITKNEGATIVAFMMATGRLKTMNKDLDKLLPFLLNLEWVKHGRQKSLKLFNEFFKNTTLPSADIFKLEQLISDVVWFSCCQESVSLHAKYNEAPTYAYLYAHRGEWTYSKLTGVTEELGVSHADDLLMLFRDKHFGRLSKGEDTKVSQIVLDFWTSFVTEGVPSSELSKSAWSPITDEMRCMILQAEPLLVEESYPFSQRTSFVQSVLSGEYSLETEHLKIEL